MTQKYKDILDKFDQLHEKNLSNGQIETLRKLLSERNDTEIDKFLEDKGELKIILRSYY